jgi:hypothetical protein
MLTGVGARGSFKKALVVDLSLSSDEGDLIADVSHDEEFARTPFGDLNRDFLGLPGDGKIISLSDSVEEEEEVREEKTPDTEAGSSSTTRPPAPTTSVDDVDGTDKGDTLDRVIGGSSSGGDKAGLP